jgi:hypothetical protein
VRRLRADAIHPLGAELRAFVLGYGSVIFADPEVEAPRLRRVNDGS